MQPHAETLPGVGVEVQAGLLTWRYANKSPRHPNRQPIKRQATWRLCLGTRKRQAACGIAVPDSGRSSRPVFCAAVRPYYLHGSAASKKASNGPDGWIVCTRSCIRASGGSPQSLTLAILEYLSEEREMPGLRPHHPQRSVRRCPPQDSIWVNQKSSPFGLSPRIRRSASRWDVASRWRRPLPFFGRRPSCGALTWEWLPKTPALSSALACRLSGWQLITRVLENRQVARHCFVVLTLKSSYSGRLIYTVPTCCTVGR
jgi:hypothetical protein